MEEVQIAQVNLGDTPPLIHRVSQPLLDERGTTSKLVIYLNFTKKIIRQCD